MIKNIQEIVKLRYIRLNVHVHSINQACLEDVEQVTLVTR